MGKDISGKGLSRLFAPKLAVIDRSQENIKKLAHFFGEKIYLIRITYAQVFPESSPFAATTRLLLPALEELIFCILPYDPSQEAGNYLHTKKRRAGELRLKFLNQRIQIQFGSQRLGFEKVRERDG